MPSSFPAQLDALNNPGATDKFDTPGLFHDVAHSDGNDAIEALEAKVGVDGSAVATSIDFLIKNLAGGHRHDGVGSRAVRHSDTSERTADDHHPQVHPLGGADHTGAITDLQHGVRGAALHADSHAQVHAVGGADHTGLRTGRVSTGAVPIGGAVEIAVMWATAFPDANYTVTMMVEEATAGTNTLRGVRIVSKTAAQVVVRIVNDDVASRTGIIHAIAVSD